MKRNLKLLFVGLISFVLTVGCTTSNDVASGGIIQKRKYNKGFFIKTGVKNSKLKKAEESFVSTDVPTVKKTYHQDVQSVESDINHSAQHIEEVSSKSETVSRIFKESPKQESENTSFKLVQKNQVNLDKKPSIAAKVSTIKTVKTELKRSRKSNKLKSSDDDIDPVLLYVLCFFVPFVAVGLVTNWDTNQVLLNLLLCLLCGIPGIIHALIVVSKNV